MGVGYAVIMPLAFSRAANDGRQRPGIAVAGVATFGYGGFLLGPVVIGTLAELATLKIAFGLLALLAIVVAIAATALAKPAPRLEPSEAASRCGRLGARPWKNVILISDSRFWPDASD